MGTSKKHIGKILFKGRLNNDNFTSKLLNNFSGERLNGTIKEKRSGKRNRHTIAAVPVSDRIIFMALRKTLSETRFLRGNDYCIVVFSVASKEMIKATNNV